MTDTKSQCAAEVMSVCRIISDRATSMMEKARWSGERAGNQIMVGRRGIAEGIVADYLSALSSAVAKGDDVEAAYQRASEGLRNAIKRFNAGVEWQVQRNAEDGQNTLRSAFWQLSDAQKINRN